MMRFKKGKKVGVFTRLISITLSVICIISVFSFPVTTSADTLSELQSEYKKLEQEQKDLAEKYSDTVEKLEDKIKYQGALEEQISATMQQLDILLLRIDVLDGEIAQLEEEKVIKETDISETTEQYKDRIRAIYMSGNTGMLEFILGSDSISDFFDRVVMAKYISDHDNDIINKLENDKQELDQKILEIEENRADLNSTKLELEAKKNELDSLYSKNNSLIEELNKDEQYARTQQEKNADLMEDLNKEIEDAYRALESQTNTNGGSNGGSGGSSNNVVITDKISSAGFQWPVPGFPTITSRFQTPSRPNHNGIDIAGSGAYGASIVSTMDGTVYKVGDHGSESYGKFVMIDHGTINGKRYITLYAHCSSILVSSGQKVKQGQTIAKVGSTGRSTGPHCHFEVRVDGNFKNPLNFF